MSPFVILAGRVVTCNAASSTSANPLGVLADAGVLVENGRIANVGRRAEVQRRAGGAAVLADAPGGVLTPGLCDAHTHAAFVGSRHDEYAARMAGATYEDIAAGGGGILASMRAVRAASHEELTSTLALRLARMAGLGVTTVEVKSGYGLDRANERKQLQAIRAAALLPSSPRVVPTFLALHALPPELRDHRAGYVAEVIDRVREFAGEGLMEYVDAYVDENAFSLFEAEHVLAAAMDERIGIRLHAGQFADVGAAGLAARFGAASADHLEHVSQEDLGHMALAGTRAVLLPVASFTLGQTPPPVSLLRARGVKIVVASDANPGTAPTESLPLALALAVRQYGLTPDEALLSATREAAFSLGLGARAGVLAPSFDADLVLWDLPHEHAIVQPWGTPKTKLVLSRGAKLPS